MGKRDYSLDTLKFILIVFVVFGHVLEEFGTTGNLGTARAMIYCFHMPVFVFLSGYFSKNANPQKLVKSLLLPFFIFNTLYALLIAKSYNILKPEYVFWYLLSLFFWRLMILPFREKKKLLAVSLLLGLYVGYIADADRFLSISRTICFFPFFVAGNIFTKEHLQKVRRIPAWISVLALVACEAAVVFLDRVGVMPVKMYELIEGYKRTPGSLSILGTPSEVGWLLRLIVYLIGFVMTFSIMSLTRETTTPNILSKLGKRTLSILIISGFAVKIAFYIFKHL